MNNKALYIFAFIAFTYAQINFIQAAEKEKKIKTTLATYKKIDGINLKVRAYIPDNKRTNRPAIVFFFGGGWQTGTMGHFARQASYYAKRGYVCFTPEYRTQKKHKTTPFESLKDARSAMRWIRAHAKNYGVDPNKIIGAGGSAGGHLAAACAYTTKFNEKSDDLDVSTVPCALILYNPVIDNGPDGYGHKRIGAKYTDFSPMHTMRAPALPTLFMVGTKDKLIPVATAEKFKAKTEKLGGTCELVLFPGQGHGFFNYKKGQIKCYWQTYDHVNKFLDKLNLLNQSNNK